MTEYQKFIEGKKKTAIKSGFALDKNKLNKHLKDFQEFIVLRALEHGRYGLFADTGLGKTLMQLEWAHQVSIKTNKPVLILAPLAVVEQTIREGVKFGIKCNKLNTNIINPIGSLSGIFITNYDNLKNIDTSIFSGVVLDESSILKSFDGKTRNLIIDNFRQTPYKLACSATPSPNDHMELGNHSEFLGQMSYTEMLAMFFVHDGGETSKWRLRKHANDDFWNYVLSWSIAIDNPSTFGFNSDGYDLPKLNYIEHLIEVKTDNLDLFGESIVSATQLHQELRLSIDERTDLAADLVAKKPNEQWIIWGLQNKETDMMKRKIDGSINVQGSDSAQFKSDKLNGFSKNEFNVLITKAKLASFGMNFQSSSNMIFLSYDFSFEKFYQAVRRQYRFGQTKEVNVHILVPKNQINVKGKIIESEKKHKEMITELAKLSSEHEHKDVERLRLDDIKTDNYHLMHGDCVARMKDVKTNSVGLSVFSPPFSSLYVYSDSVEDMGNSSNYDQFEEHFKYLIPELKRVIKPGRICAIHCMDLPIQKGKEGFIGLRDFSGMLVKWFTDQGFIYHARTTIWKNPVTEMQRTKALGLLHKQIKKDSVMSRVGIPDYILFFRNEGENIEPITHQDTDPSKKDYIPVDLWQKYASPVWMDVDYKRTLQYTTARDKNDERHIAPLQLDTIDRILHLYSNEGDTVLSPFGGIGSEGFQSLKMNRKSISIELKESYFAVNSKNHRNAMEEKKMLKLF